MKTAVAGDDEPASRDILGPRYEFTEPQGGCIWIRPGDRQAPAGQEIVLTTAHLTTVYLNPDRLLTIPLRQVKPERC